MSDWTQRLHNIIDATGSFLAVTLLGGLFWMGRTFFTDRARLSALEREMQNRTERHNELRTEVKEVRAEVREGFNQLDRKLDGIMERWVK